MSQFSTLRPGARAQSLLQSPEPSGNSHGSALFSRMVGELLDGLKSGCRVAHHIEEDLIHLGWPVGMIYGSEAGLSERFQVGRAVVREAARVLEVRGCARMRRGPNGGLQVLCPSREQSVEMTADYLGLFGIEARHLDGAEDLLRRASARLACSPQRNGAALRQIDHIVLPFFNALVNSVRQLAVDQASAQSVAQNRPLFHRSRAGQIARRLMSQCTQQEWVQGVRLGSTFDLCERYGIDRDVLRQAIRILESAGMAMSVSGRGQGIVSQAPKPAAMCRFVNCHFAAHGLNPMAAMELFHAMNVEVIATVTRLATTSDIARIDKALDAMEHSSADQLTGTIYEAEESQFSIIKNPLIDLFLRSTKAFPAWDLFNDDKAALRHSVYLAETRNVAAAIARGDSAAAASAQEQKNRHIAAVGGTAVGVLRRMAS